MTKLQYWGGWIVFWAVAFCGAIVMVRWFIVNPILNRLDALMALGTRLESMLRHRI